MKTLVFIFTFLLSLLSSGKEVNADAVSSLESSFNVSAARASEKRTDKALNREMCIASAQGYTFAGTDSNNGVSIRTAPNGRRTSQQTRSSSRIVKCGKIIDNNRLHPFLAQPVLPLSGTHVSERYLFAICRLRL